ncbi:lipoate--protein ligase family protein [Ferviditalea candida]|uniref:BPL/LPL catalytic domain-containing protein n=1 Tax=Ferviditalea candida TaxID=3108399 RepID=A0ABU5ZKH9_9BACL|nr:hypothetical protein [Paenibacillaceae bacterium T2]
MLPIYQLGEVDWITTQSLYHGLAQLNEEGIVLCWPATPYVSLGCHQAWEDYNEECGLPVVRRKVGGSLVYLDRRQVFFQIIVNPRRVTGSRTPERWYRYALDPVVSYLKRLGLSAELRLPADILAGGRKISGNAGGQLEDRVVVVGNLLLDFSVEAMAEVRSAPHDIMRLAFADSMRNHLTTLCELLPDRIWSPERVMRDLASVFAEQLQAVPMPFPRERFEHALREAGEKLINREWLTASRSKRPDALYSIKVREGIYLRASRDPHFPRLVAEVDVNRCRLLRVWGLPGTYGDLAPLKGTQEELEAAPLAHGLKQALLDLIGAKERVAR